MHHVPGWSLHAGRRARRVRRRRRPTRPGYDLPGALHRLRRHARHRDEGQRPAASPSRDGAVTMLAAFDDVEAAGATVAAIIAAGIIPAAARDDGRARDRARPRSFVHCRLSDRRRRGPAVRGRRPGRRGRRPRSRRSTRSAAASRRDSRSVSAVDEAERAAFWRGRKSAFAAVGRISPDYIVQDGVVPRTRARRPYSPRSRRSPPQHGLRVRQRLPRRRRQPAPARALRRRTTPAQLDAAEKVSARSSNLCIEHGGIDHRRARRRRREVGVHGEHVHRR